MSAIKQSASADEATPGQTIRHAIEERVKAAPDGDLNSPLIEEALNNSELATERFSGALRRLAATGLLFEHRREKVAGRQAAKDRKVIQYRATDVFKRQLGILAAPPPVANGADMLRAVHTFVEAKGFNCTLNDVANYFLCLQAKPFVIFSGISGTGKTRLPRLVAEATDASHQLIPVKPNWTDNSDLMGYYSVTLNRFVPGQLLEAIRAAADDPSRPHFVVLDEMNLAHVEHYLSDLLSIMETRTRGKNDLVTTDVIPLDLPPLVQRESVGSSGVADVDETEQTDELGDSLREVRLPWNLFIVGTVNVDETTHPFSRKVLDRANAIDYNRVDLLRFKQPGTNAVPDLVLGANALFLDRPYSVGEVYDQTPEFFDAIAKELTLINAELQAAELHFAYRVRDEICLYLWAWRRHALASVLSRDDALDFCLLQKVLPRCQGSTESARQALEGVFRYATQLASTPPVGDGMAQTNETPQVERTGLDVKSLSEPTSGPGWRYPRTARKALSMLRRYADTGYFAYWS